jgi:hypothetical protein
MANTSFLHPSIAPSENGNRLMGKNSSLFEVIPDASHLFVCLSMNPILSPHQMTPQFASGTSKPISKSETLFGTTTESMLLPCPLMDNILPILPLDQMRKYMCRWVKQYLLTSRQVIDLCFLSRCISLFLLGTSSSIERCCASISCNHPDSLRICLLDLAR